MAQINQEIRPKNMVTILYALRTNQTVDISPADLHKELKNEYSVKTKSGKVCYEYFNAEKQAVKPHIDYEEYVEHDPSTNFSVCREKEELLNNVLCELFNVKINEWAISSDSRFCEKKKMFKISFHYVLHTKKVSKISHLKWFIEQNESAFNKVGLIIPDTKVYRDTLNKWRVPMAKKDYSDKQSLMAPSNYWKSPTDYAKHLVSYIDESMTEFVIDAPKNLNEKKEKYRMTYNEHEQYNTEEIEDIVNSYTVITQKISGDFVYYDIADKLCGKQHNNNNNLIIFDQINMTLSVKCHSARCKNFRRMIYKPVAPTEHFDELYMQNIPIPEGEEDNYKQAKKYFEQFFIKIRDTNSYYRINKMFSDRYNYLEKELVPIKIEGYTRDLYYKSAKDNAEKQENFYKRYDADAYKDAFHNVVFAPYNTENLGKIDEKKYNLFEGFNYTRVLSYKERKSIEQQKQEDFDFLLDHILKYICDNNEKHYDYLMQFFANIIQDPTNIPQIILGFYSKSHGTGKSNLTKFLANVLGHDLSYFGSLGQITESHTHAHVGRLMNVVEEVNRFGTRANNSMIKDFSQRESAVYNEKNKSQCNIKVYVRYIFTTNDSDGIYFDSEDRRYVLYTFQKLDGEESKENKDHIKRLEDVMKDKTMIYMFGKFLAQYNITYKKPSEWISNRHKTEDYFSMMSEDSITEFLKEFLTLDCISMDEVEHTEYLVNENDTVLVKKDTYHKLYKEYHTDNNNGKPKGKNNFYKALNMTYKDAITTVRQKTKQYFKINLKLLWKQLGLKEEYLNYHIGSLEERELEKQEKIQAQKLEDETLAKSFPAVGKIENVEEETDATLEITEDIVEPQPVAKKTKPTGCMFID